MKEHYFKKVNVLGIDVSVMRPEKAVNISMDLMRAKGLNTVFFLSAGGSLFCQNSDWAAGLVQSLDLVLTGDRHTEMAAVHQNYNSDVSDETGRFADEYLMRLFHKLNREYREIYAVMEQRELLDALQAYLQEVYPGISFQGIVYEGETDAEPDKVVNEINAFIPDVVFLCLPVEQQLLFVREYSAMMNTRLCICMESMQALLHKINISVPRWVNLMHLNTVYRKLKGERKLQDMIVGSIFKKKILNDTETDEPEEKDEL